MGEIADSMIDGTCCQFCGNFIGGATGYPRSCRFCLETENEYRQQAKPKKLKCHCGKRFATEQGLADHKKAVHRND